MGKCVILWYEIRYRYLGMLYGEYRVSMDAKGRLLIPSDFRKQIPEGDAMQFILKQSTEQCITLYTKMEWQKLSAQLEEMSAFNPKINKFKRLFLNGIAVIDVDSAGRILIPKALQTYAQLTKEVVFWAQGNKVEIWDKDIKAQYIEQFSDDEEDLANELFS